MAEIGAGDGAAEHRRALGRAAARGGAALAALDLEAEARRAGFVGGARLAVGRGAVERRAPEPPRRRALDEPTGILRLGAARIAATAVDAGEVVSREIAAARATLFVGAAGQARDAQAGLLASGSKGGTMCRTFGLTYFSIVILLLLEGIPVQAATRQGQKTEQVALTMIGTTFGMPDNRVFAGKFTQHAASHFAGKCAGFMRRQVLRSERDGAPRERLLALCQIGRRHTHGNIAPDWRRCERVSDTVQ